MHPRFVQHKLSGNTLHPITFTFRIPVVISPKIYLISGMNLLQWILQAGCTILQSCCVSSIRFQNPSFSTTIGFMDWADVLGEIQVAALLHLDPPSFSSSSFVFEVPGKLAILPPIVSSTWNHCRPRPPSGRLCRLAAAVAAVNVVIVAQCLMGNR